MVWLLPAFALAQDVAPPDPFGEDEMDSDMPEVDNAGDVATEEEAGQPDVQLPLQKRAKVVQKKLYPKEGKWEINLFFGVNPADSFTLGIVEGLRLSYHIHEYFGVQVVGGYMQSFDRNATSLLTDDSSNGGLEIDPDFIKNAELQWMAGADFVFYPVYGKFSLMSDLIAHYDAGIYVGAAAVGLANGDIGPAPDLGVFGNIYINKWLSVRADFMYYALIATDKRQDPAAGVTGTDVTGGVAGLDQRGGTLVRHNYFITLGLSFHLPVD
jgi:outer membrane beta-barrel protein